MRSYILWKRIADLAEHSGYRGNQTHPQSYVWLFIVFGFRGKSTDVSRDTLTFLSFLTVQISDFSDKFLSHKPCPDSYEHNKQTKSAKSISNRSHSQLMVIYIHID